MKTLSTAAKAAKESSSASVVWLVEIDADAPTGGETIYLASRAYTLDGQAYLDALELNGLTLGPQRLRVGCGLVEVGRGDVAVALNETLAALRDQYFFDNDALRVYVIFATGTETAADKVPLFAGVVEDAPYTVTTWKLGAIDGSDKDWRDVPVPIVTPSSHPNAALDSYGKPQGAVFGDFKEVWWNYTGTPLFAVPLLQTDLWAATFLVGPEADSYGQLYQYYPESRRWAYLPATAYSASGGVVTVTSADRTLRLRPVLPSATNECADWHLAADNDDDTAVTVAAGAQLRVWSGGVAKAGTVTQGNLNLLYVGAGDYDLRYNGASIDTDSFSSGGPSTISAAIPDFVTRHTDNWDMELYEVWVTGGVGGATIREISIDVRYHDRLSQEGQAQQMHLELEGWEDKAAYYRDGAVVYADGFLLESPAHVLAAVLRGQRLVNLPTASVSSAAVIAANNARTAWKVATVLDEQVRIDWLNRFAFQFGLHVFKDASGTWKMVAQDKTHTPEHTFGAWNIAVKNPDASPAQWEPDLTYGRTAMRDLINEAAIAYRLSRATGTCDRTLARSGTYRLTGTAAITQGSPASTGTLTDDDGGRDFAAAGVLVNDVVYVYGYGDYTVTEVGTTTLTLAATSGDVEPVASGTTFYVGPNLSGPMLRSQLRYKTQQTLSGQRPTFLAPGQYACDAIGEDTTAGLLLDHLVDWRSQRRLTVAFATFLNAVDVEVGDFAWFTHATLPADRQPAAVGVLSAKLETVTNTLSGHYVLGLRADDHLLIDDEVVRVVSHYACDGVTIQRAKCNTSRAEHAQDATVYLLNRVRWEVAEVQVDIPKAQVRLTLQEAPPSYRPIGRVVAQGYPAYADASAAERVAAGWATYWSGRVVDSDEHSDRSYVGPDTGTY